MMWNQAEAIKLCRLLEAFAPEFGCHVALTGGCLYGEGERKDVDILFYNIRQVDSLDRVRLLDALRIFGFQLGEQFGWVQKATYKGKNVDLFFPEQYPSAANQPNKYRG